MEEQRKKEEANFSAERKKAIAFMLRRDKPGLAKRKPEPEPELVIGEQSGEGVFLGTWQQKDREGKIYFIL